MIEKKMNLNEALGMVKKAVELKPNDGYIVDSLGWAISSSATLRKRRP
jgi:hypothetical protein